MVNFFVWKSPSSVNIVDILALRGVSELMWCWRETASVAAWDLLHSGLWSPNSWSSQDAASESSASASEGWRRLWFRIGSDCQDHKIGHPWSAQARINHSKSCQNRICANLALLVLWNRYLTLLAKNLPHASPIVLCSSTCTPDAIEVPNICHRFSSNAKTEASFTIHCFCAVPNQKSDFICTCPFPYIFFFCYIL